MDTFSKDILKHYGVAKRSGRYPWGSGDDPYQHSGDFLSRVDALRKANTTYIDPATGKVFKGETAIAKTIGLSVNEYKIQKTLALKERRDLNAATARDLRDKGYSLPEITRRMGYKNDSSIRNLLNEDIGNRMSEAEATAKYLKERVDTVGMIDIGPGVEKYLGVSDKKLKDAVYLLEREGYHKYKGRIPQATNPGKHTTLSVLAPPEAEWKDMFQFKKDGTQNIFGAHDKISKDGGDTFEQKWTYPKSMDSKRLKIRYDEDGGSEKDGVIELRRGVDDISLGKSKYSQVRILVDGKKYIKGMAVYNDNMPDGVDVIFNTNKSKKLSKLEVLKDISKDPDNPFGSLIKEGIDDPTNPNSDDFKGGQSYYIDKKGKKQLSLINKRAAEGDWEDWKDALPSQFLAKQNKDLIDKQLTLALENRKAEFDSIKKLTNPTIKKELLEKFADDCDSAAVHLKAAALPRQKYHAILPITTMKDNEVFAPKYKDGEQVALIRYPHGGLFEIPVLTVNNRNRLARNIIGMDAPDAIGINKKIADQLSGADFDGDTVMVIPTNNRVRISSKPPLSQLEGFDAKKEYGYEKKVKQSNGDYKYYDKSGKEFKPMLKNSVGNEMGRISNLITDMTVKGANDADIAKAVKHSMVVIDAEKHKLDYRKSAIDNDIATLKSRYQGYTTASGKTKGGASTLLSRSSAEIDVPKRRGTPKIDPKTGKLLFNEVDEEYTSIKIKDPVTKRLRNATPDEKNYYYKNKDLPGGVSNYKVETKKRMQKSSQMYETDDAFTLSSGSEQETMYATYANAVKAMGNEARKTLVTTGGLKYSPSAKKTYSKEVESLNSKLNISVMNSPKERQAQVIARSAITAKKQSNPDLSPSELKKINQQELSRARVLVGANRHSITITDSEWNAIQAGAISDSKLKEILKYADIDELRQRATPRETQKVTTFQQSKLKAMVNSGNYTLSEIAQATGLSMSTISKYK